MNKRSRILILVLGLSFIGMMTYISKMQAFTSEFAFLGLLFGALLITIALIGLKVEARPFKGKSIFTVVFGSLAMGFGMFLLVIVLALPTLGFESIDAVISKYAGIIWLGLAIAMSPIAAKYMK